MTNVTDLSKLSDRDLWVGYFGIDKTLSEGTVEEALAAEVRLPEYEDEIVRRHGELALERTATHVVRNLMSPDDMVRWATEDVANVVDVAEGGTASLMDDEDVFGERAHLDR